MSVAFRYKFKKGFFLDENRLIKIDEILNEYIAAYQSAYPSKDSGPTLKSSVKYQVYRIDSSLFTTENVQDVCREENDRETRIERLNIEINEYSLQTSVRLEFSTNDNFFISDGVTTDLNITGINPVLTEKLFLELKQYLTKKVNTFRGMARWTESISFFAVISLWMIIVLSVSIAVLSSVYSAKPQVSSQELQAILNSQDTNKKLDFLINFLIQSRNLGEQKTISLKDLVLPFILFSIPLWLLIASILPTKNKLEAILKYLFPRSVFYLGERIEEYKNLTQLRDKVLWGVIVAMLVSFVAGLPYYLVTK